MSQYQPGPHFPTAMDQPPSYSDSQQPLPEVVVVPELLMAQQQGNPDMAKPKWSPPPSRTGDQFHGQQGMTSMSQPDYHPQQQQVVVVQQPQPQMMHIIPFGPNRQEMQCYHCRQQVITTIDHEPGGHAQTAALILCLLGGLLCVWIPYVCADCQDVHHQCPQCGRRLGTYAR